MSKPRLLLKDHPMMDRYALAPLNREGYVYVDELQNMPMPKLCEIVSGPKSQIKIAKMLNREDEYNRYRGKFDIELDGEIITGGQLRQFASLAGTARAVLQNGGATAMDLMDAINHGIVTWEQVARYILDNKRAKRELVASLAEKQPKEAIPVPVAPLVNLAEFGPADAEITALVEQYKKDYDVTQWTGADWDAVRRLAMLEIYANRTQMLLLNQGSSSAFQFAPQLKALSDQVSTTMTSIARIRDDMGISLKSRADKDRTLEAHDAIREFAAEAKQLVARRSSILIHCGIRLGLVLPHFPRGLRIEGKVIQVCPRCGAEVEWQLVTQEMLDTYTEAGDFVPAGTPPGAFDYENAVDMIGQRHKIERESYATSTGI